MRGDADVFRKRQLKCPTAVGWFGRVGASEEYVQIIICLHLFLDSAIM